MDYYDGEGGPGRFLVVLLLVTCTVPGRYMYSRFSTIHLRDRGGGGVQTMFVHRAIERGRGREGGKEGVILY